MRKWILFAFTFFLLLFFFFHFYHFLKARVTTSEFQSQTEKKLTQLFNAKVKVGKIRFGLLKQVSLSGLQIGKINSDVPLEVDVQRITIKYNLADFLGQNFRVPAEVLIDAPAVSLESLVSPFDMFKMLGVKGGSGSAGFLKKIELNNGKFQVKIPNLNLPFLIEHIKGKFSLENPQLVHVNLTGAIGGIADGRVTVFGEFNPERKTGQLELNLENTDLKISSVPLTGLTGKIIVNDDAIQFQNLKLNVRNMPVELFGKIEHAFGKHPKWELHLELPHFRKRVFSINFSGDAALQTFSGSVDAVDKSLTFQGAVHMQDHGIELDRIKFDSGYEARAAFNYETGIYSFRANKGVERFNFDLNLNDFKADLELGINHWKIADHDFTSNAYIRLEPIDDKWKLGNYRFRGSLKTNYLILDYHPLQDFNADFEISELGLNPLTANWGHDSHLNGSIGFGPQPSVDFNADVAKIDLKALQAVGIHPLPVSLEGNMDGKIRIIGNALNPDVNGRLSVQAGKISDFKFNEATIEFYGTMPRLKLLDSKIIKKDKTFMIQGEVDFELKNILQKVKIVSLEQVVIWKGLDVESEVETRHVDLPTTTVTSELLKPLNASTNDGKQKIEAEYDVGANRSIQVTAEKEKDGDQAVVTVGPKIRF